MLKKEQNSTGKFAEPPRRAGEEIQRNYDTQKVINSLLSLALEDIPLEKILNRAIELVVSIPWLTLKSMGGIFLRESDPDILVLEAEKGLSEPIKKACARVPVGKCICGRAALTQEIQYVDCVDANHEIRYEGMTPHGHYCVPIVLKDRTVGVLTLYVEKGHPRDRREEEFLGAVANTLAGIIMRKRAEEERERLEAQLFQAQKMEAVSAMAGGIAHDFNNLLQTFQGACDFLLRRTETGDPTYEVLQRLTGAVKSGTALTRQLLTFSRSGESKREPVDLNHELGEIKKLLERTIPKMITIELHLAEDLKTISADQVQIEQVLLNLALNARDAMPEGGSFIIRTANVTLGEEQCQRHLEATPGDYVLLSVSDTGHGMDEETLARIFEPFFTTKERGKGTGLGLAVVYGMVKSHGGFIECSSEFGAGTRFEIYLPAMESVEEATEVDKREEGLWAGTETILLVDDEEPVRHLGKHTLEMFGYTALTAADGETALELYRRERNRIHLIILDLSMPGMDGQQCLEELLKIDPQAKVLIASGYSTDGPAKEAVEAGAKGLISKPYTAEQFLKEVRRVLDED